MSASIRVLTILVCLLGTGVIRAEDWKYIVPPAGDPTYPIGVAQMLSASKPADLNEENAPYRGKLRRYAQVRYGNPSSVRVTLVIDELEDGTADLYVDANRDRRIEERDRAPGAGPEWQLPLDVAIAHDDEVDLHLRRVSIRRGATGRTLAVATLGCMEGQISLGSRLLLARRVDGDANGMFSDAQDRLWIDEDADGRWEPFTEQMVFASILRMGGTRYAVRSDLVGDRLSLEPLIGSGAVQLVLPALAEQGGQAKASVTLVGRDGSAVLISGPGESVEVPSGEYQMQIAMISVTSKDDSRRWNFHFSANRRECPWHKVETGATLQLDPIGKLDFVAELEGDKTTCRPGESLTVNPRLYTGEGLLINACYLGTDSANEDNHSRCSVTLAEANTASEAKPTLASATSGFV